jgi:hypothetical protein
MLAKVPLTGYFFALGERVYPLWWWITIPALLVIGLAFARGLGELRRWPGIRRAAVLALGSIPFLYLVLDPLAPPTLQGAAPRYLIYALPLFVLVVALGAAAWRPLRPLVALAQLAGLGALLAGAWSYGGLDLMDWPGALHAAIPVPTQACIIPDGRAADPVARYAPPGTRSAADLAGCAGASRIVLVSDDYRVAMDRQLDTLAAALQADYALVTNMTLFPAQITVYERRAGGDAGVAPARLALPESDLRLPLAGPGGEPLWGFARLDDVTPQVRIPLRDLRGPLRVLTNYRAPAPLPPGTPVLQLQFITPGAAPPFILHAGQETAAWDGACAPCTVAGGWTKRLALLGAQAYPDAYREYPVSIWAAALPALPTPQEAVVATRLLAGSTVYFWRIEENKDK